MSSESAIRALQSAIDNVREQCGKDPKCKSLIATLDLADKEAEKLTGQPYDQAADDKEKQGTPDTDVANQPKDLKSAAVTARLQFGAKRAADAKAAAKT